MPTTPGESAATSRVFPDTNFLVYLVDRAEPGKRAVARRIWEAEASAHNVVLSTQVLQEFFSVTTRAGRGLLTQAEAERMLHLFSAHPVVSTDPELVLAAVRRVRADRISIWDALIVEAALAAGCARLLTEDLQHGRQFGGLLVENPFRGVKRG